MAGTAVVVGSPSADEQIRALAAQVKAVTVDLDAIHAAFLALTAKLDADGDLTDTDFGTTCDPAAITAAPVIVQGE